MNALPFLLFSTMNKIQYSPNGNGYSVKGRILFCEIIQALS